MVDATVDNDPVSIVLGGGQSTTVPANETWRVSIYLAGGDRTDMDIDGLGEYKSEVGSPPGNSELVDVTLVGGQTIAEATSSARASIFITGFVVNS